MQQCPSKSHHPSRHGLQKTINNTSLRKHRDVYHLAMGIEVPVFKGIGLFTEYKYTTTAPRGEISGGQAKVDLDTHHLVAGLAFHW
ncbi:hypothetical protein MYX84_08955 [Acidobacteria bacterium AH-259-O06]|nr:hypothetical protein [Acidobacteria bacterium AH-259-O06]